MKKTHKKTKAKDNPIISFFKNIWVRNILSALAVAIFGFILLNLTFIFDAIYQGVIRGIVSLFIPLTIDTRIHWLPGLFHGSFAVLVCIISYFVFRTRLKDIYKAIYMTVPVATVLVTLGIFLYQWPIIQYSVCGIVCLCALYYFYRTKQPWIYYYTVILVSITLTVYTLTGGEI